MSGNVAKEAVRDETIWTLTKMKYQGMRRTGTVTDESNGAIEMRL